MKILFLISGHHAPSSRFRVLAFVPHLRRLGHQCQVLSSFPEKYDYFPTIGWRASQLLKRAVRIWHLLRAWQGRFDVIVVERGLFHDNTFSMERRFRRIARTMVLDVDDAVFLDFPEKFRQLAAMSDLVIAGNRHLAEYVQPLNPQVVVLPTCVDLDDYRPKPATTASQKPVIGWIGVTGNLQYLNVAAPALRRLAAHSAFQLRLIAGDEHPLREIDLSGVDVDFRRWQPQTEVDEIRGFDIGLMPLFSDRPWDKYKCGLKLLQYMAVGIPGVASPVGVNSDIVQHGATGFLAAQPSDWEQILERLINDPPLRCAVGTAARQRVAEHYSIQANLPLLVQSLERAQAPHG